jgi:hypothetical protein
MGGAGRGGDVPQAGDVRASRVNIEGAPRFPDIPPPVRHAQALTVTERGDRSAALTGPPELILAPPAGEALRADEAPAPVIPAPGAEPDAGGQHMRPLPDAASAAGPDGPPDAGLRGMPASRADDSGVRSSGPDAETTEAPASRAAHEVGQRMPAEARYRSALDPLLPAPLPPAPPRRGVQAVRVAVPMPSAPAARVAEAARRRAEGPPARRYQPAADGLVTERVPAGLASAFRALHGADVSDVPVRRGRAVSRQAMQLDAAAFSHGGAVYLPDSAGSLSPGQAQALLAHELTHAVQQQMLGAALPGEASAEGRELEEQAVATQRWFLGAPGPVPSLTSLPSGTAAQLTHAPAVRHASSAAPDEPSGVFTAESAGAPMVLWPPGGHGPAGQVGVQRQPAEASPMVTAAPATADGAAAAPDASAAVADAQSSLGDLKSQVADLAGARPDALDDPVELDELAAKLYRRMRSLLRLELIVDRERAGLLTDFR